MKCKTVFLIAICCITLGTAEPVMPYTWNSYGGHVYTLTDTWETWTAAETEAQAAGGHLATINDASENSWLTSTFDAYSQSYHGSPSHNAALIGYYQDVDLGWKWISGEPVTYTNYYGLFPQGGVHAYIHLSNHPSPGTWNANTPHDTNPDYYFRGIIEAVPIPSAIWLLGSGLIGLVGLRKKFKR